MVAKGKKGEKTKAELEQGPYKRLGDHSLIDAEIKTERIEWEMTNVVFELQLHVAPVPAGGDTRVGGRRKGGEAIKAKPSYVVEMQVEDEETLNNWVKARAAFAPLRVFVFVFVFFFVVFFFHSRSRAPRRVRSRFWRRRRSRGAAHAGAVSRTARAISAPPARPLANRTRSLRSARPPARLPACPRPSARIALQCSAVQCSAVQCSAVQCSAVQCSAVHCIVLHCIACHAMT